MRRILTSCVALLAAAALIAACGEPEGDGKSTTSAAKRQVTTTTAITTERPAEQELVDCGNTVGPGEVGMDRYVQARGIGCPAAHRLWDRVKCNGDCTLPGWRCRSEGPANTDLVTTTCHRGDQTIIVS